MGTHRTILVVEDDPDVRATLSDVLEDEGYIVIGAPNGQEALEHLRRYRPCAVLLDLMMPVMNGWELIGVMKDDRLLSAIPVIVTSAMAAEAPATLPVKRALQKPIEMDVLLATIGDYCCGSA